MKKVFLIGTLLIFLLPLAIQVVFGQANLTGAYIEWSSEALRSASVPNVELQPDIAGNASGGGKEMKQDYCSPSQMLLIVATGTFILFLLYWYHAPERALRLAAKVNTVLFFECLLQVLHELYFDQLHGTPHLLVLTAAMSGILPIHHYVEGQFYSFLKMHTPMELSKAIVTAVQRTLVLLRVELF